MGSGSNPVGEYECIDVRWSDPDGVEHADVSQFTERAEPVHRLGGYVEVCSDLLYGQQRPQPVRRILGERCESLRLPGIQACRVPSSCKRLRSLATPWVRLIRPSKPLVGGSSPSRRALLGNPTLAVTMIRHDVNAGLFVPVELLLTEQSEGRGTSVLYVRPSS